MRPLRTSSLCACLAVVFGSFAGCSFTPNPISVSSLTVDFGGTPVVVGQAAIKTVALTNTGSSSVQLAFKLGGPNPDDFRLLPSPASASVADKRQTRSAATARLSISVVATPADSTPCAIMGPAALAAGQTCSLSISFQPQAPGTRTATLVITPTGSSVSQGVELTGSAVAATRSLSFSPAAINFSDTLVGNKLVSPVVTVTNTGNSPITIGEPLVTGANPGDFSFTGDLLPGLGLCTPLLVLNPGVNCHLTVAFHPTAAGLRTGNLVLGQSTGLPNSLALSGTGVTPVRTLTLSPTSLNFPDTAVGVNSGILIAIITNTGNAPVTLRRPTPLTGANPLDFFQVDECPGVDILAPGQRCSIIRQFNPKAVGPRSATEFIDSDASNSPLLLQLSGNGINAVRTLTISPTSLDFGSKPVGSTSHQSITVTSTGNAPAGVTGAANTGGIADFVLAVPPACAALSPGQSCNLDVAFTPATTGLRSGAYELTGNADGLPLSVSMSGTGIAAVRTIVLSPTSLTFADTPVGSRSEVMSATISNTGNVPVTVGGFAGSGNDLDFTEGLSCRGSVIAPGSQCLQQFVFAPKALGPRSATIAISSDADGSDLRIALSGTAIAPTRAITLTPSSLNFPDKPVGVRTPTETGLTVTITSTGNSPVTLGNRGLFGGTNAGDFTVPGEPSGSCSVMAPGAQCQVIVVFIPQATGPRSATFFVTSDADSPPQPVALFGTGVNPVRTLSVSPTSLTFPVTPVVGVVDGGGSPPQTVTVTSTGNAPITINGIIPGGSNPGDFLVDLLASGDSCLGNVKVLAPGASCTFNVQFVPSAVGSRTASVTVDSDTTGLPGSISVAGTGRTATRTYTISPSPLVLPDTAVGFTSATRTLSVVNTGGLPVTVSNIGLPSDASFDQVSSSSGCTVLLYGEPCLIEYEFKPATSGPHTGNVAFATDATQVSQTAVLSGNGAAEPTRTLTVTDATFPDTVVGDDSPPRSVTATNTGTADLTLSSDLIAPHEASTSTSVTDFFRSSAAPPPGSVLCEGAVLRPGGSCVQLFHFRPTTTGPQTAVATFNSDAANSPTDATLQGTGIAGAKTFTVSPNALSFPDTAVGATSAPQTITVRSAGTEPVTLDNIVLGSGPFAISANDCPAVLNPGATCTVSVTFAPLTLNSFGGRFDIFSPDASDPFIVILLSGKAASVLSLAPTSFDFGADTLGAATAPRTATYTNISSATVVFAETPITVTGDTGDFQYSTDCVSLDPGQSCSVTVRFIPTALGSRSSTATGVLSGVTTPIPSLNVAGFGTPPPTLIFSPATLDFPATPLGATSAPLDVTITNVGTKAETYSATFDSIGANPADFSTVAVSCPTPIPAGTSCTFSVAFSPKALGPRSSDITVSTSDSGSPHITHVTGIGIGAAPTLVFSPTTLNFPDTVVGSTSAPLNVTITNVGTKAETYGATFDSIGANPADFSTVAVSCPTPIPAGTSCTFSVAFSPKALGPRSSDITVSTSDSGSPHLTHVTGTGISGTRELTLAPTSLTFAPTSVGSAAAPQTFTITNTGSAAVSLTLPISLSGDSGDFTISTTCGPTLTASSNCTVTLAFAPTATGARNATATIVSDASGSPQSVTLTGIGTAPTFSIGGTITGLTHAGLVLANGTDTVSPAANATSFVFSTKLPTGASYAVTVATQPTAETCFVFSGSGTVGTSDVNSVQVTCSPNTAQWVWMNGPKTTPGLPSFGTLGVPSASNIPGARDMTASWMDAAGNFWLFGGRATDKFGQEGAFNDLWKFDRSTGEWTWMGGSSSGDGVPVWGTQGVPSTANIPGSRVGPVTWTDDAGNFWLFGGESPVNADILDSGNDLWRFNPTTGEWTWMNGGVTTTQHGIYGTMGVPDPSNVPGLRMNAMSWKDSTGNLWLFGGEGFAVASGGRMNDLWKYSPTTNQWTWVNGSNIASDVVVSPGVYGTQGIASPTNNPGQREAGRTWTDSSGNLWLFGGVGFDGSGHFGFLNDLWKYDISSGQWTWISGSNTNGSLGVYGTKGTPSVNNAPPARRFAMGWTDSDGTLWMFGGESVLGRKNDLWRFNSLSGEWMWISGSSSQEAPGAYGTLGEPSDSNLPGGRTAGAYWIDPSGNFWVFGGFGLDSVGNSDVLSDLWKYER
jgi:hypothetical protein